MTAGTVDFTTPASETELQAAVARLRDRNFDVVVVQSSVDVKAAVLQRIPEGATVHSGKSKTLEDSGVFKELMESERFDFVRRRTSRLDRKTRWDAP